MLEQQLKPPARRLGAGFTLIELLVVLGILAVIAAFVGPNLIGKGEDANAKAAKVQVEQLASGVDIYRLEVGSYPPTLLALVTKPEGAERWKGPYLRKPKLPKDPWGRDYRYRIPGTHGTPYDIYSLGSDGKPGGDGHGADVGSWQ